MLLEFLPAIISITILAVVFLAAWIADLRRIRSLNVTSIEQVTVGSMIPMDGRDQLPSGNPQ